MACPARAQPETRQNTWKDTSSGHLYGRSMIDGVDELAHRMERKWGVDRLRLLVSDDLRHRFDRQRFKLNAAITSGDHDALATECARMRKALETLDAAAEAIGAEPIAPEVWEVALPDGTVAAVVRTTADAHHVVGDGRLKRVYTLAEVANLIHACPEVIKAKDTFPGAEVVAVRSRPDPLEGLDDEIPF